MRFFHLADLHIGKKVNGYSMVDDQRVILDEVVDYIKEDKPDAVILAGDIYDRRDPPLEAIALFDRFVSTVVLELGVPILAIGGNHDGGERLGFANQILSRAGFHLSGIFQWPLKQLRMIDAEGPVDVVFLPYADLTVIHAKVPETSDMDYADAMDYLLQQTPLADDARHVLIAHGVVMGNDALETTDSERTLSIGGTEFWRSESLKDYQYVALGHLHRAQRAGAENIRYAGSMMQYSFSEENQQKVLLQIDIDDGGNIDISARELHAPHKLKTIHGFISDLLKVPQEVEPFKNDYLRVILDDTDELFEPMNRLKQCFPNIMLLERSSLHSEMALGNEEDLLPTEVKAAPIDLFQQFYGVIHTDELPSEDMLEVMRGVLDEAGRTIE